VSARRPASRHRSREAALQVLYAVDHAARQQPAVRAAQAALDDVASHFELPEAARAFTTELVRGVTEHLEEVDAAISAQSTHWRLERMPAVDRNVLRIAAWEILYGKTPAAVAIDEAVGLARRFGSERSAAFVNGVLDALARAAAERMP
jgi:N utilization substance protein B